MDGRLHSRTTPWRITSMFRGRMSATEQADWMRACAYRCTMLTFCRLLAMVALFRNYGEAPARKLQQASGTEVQQRNDTPLRCW